MMRRIFSLWAAALVLASFGSIAQAQGNPFAPVVYINDKAVTNYEVSQRKIMLRLFRTPGDLDKLALEGLIDDRIRGIAADLQGVNPSEEGIIGGEEEFASRANLSREEFIRALAGQGVSRETFRDFVRAGMAWRQVVRDRFGPRAQVTEEEVDRALSLTSRRGGAEVFVTELILAANNPAAAARADETVARIRSTVTSEAAFSSFARRNSVAPSRGRGGRLPDPLELSNLPPQLAAIFLTLGPNEVSPPIPLPNAVALFMVRELRETGAPEVEDLTLEYAQYFIPGGRSEKTLQQAEKIRRELDTCDDLYGVAKGQPEEQLLRDTNLLADIPQDIAFELAKLDEGEHSIALTRGDNLMLLMLCGRTVALAEDANREAVRDRLLQQRLASYADGYLAELRADAIIRFP